jgi:hypothetical protein
MWHRTEGYLMKSSSEAAGTRGFRQILTGISLMAIVVLGLILPASSALAADKLRFAVGRWKAGLPCYHCREARPPNR